MFGMVPFERHEDNFFDVFDNFERKFFGNSSANLPAFRTDIKDADDKFVLEAELPGFDKEDISLDVKDGILTISAQHKEEKEDKDEKGQYIRRERRRKRHHRRLQQRHPHPEPAQDRPRRAGDPQDRH